MKGWEARNAAWVEKLGLQTRDRVVPDPDVVLGMDAVWPVRPDYVTLHQEHAGRSA